MDGDQVTYLWAIGGGILSFLSPCVLPIVPAYLSFITGSTLEQMTERREMSARGRMILSAALFVLGFSVVFIAMGASASAINRLIVENIELLSQIAGVVIMLFGVHLLGIVKIPLLYRQAQFDPSKMRGGIVGPFVIGLAFGFGWTPCIGPVLATVLAFAASQDSLGYGVSLLGAYALGLGVPFLLAALAINPFLGFMRKFSRHLNLIEKATGTVLLLTGFLIFTGRLTELSYWFLETFPALANIG